MKDLFRAAASMTLLMFAAQNASAQETETPAERAPVVAFGELKTAGTGCYQTDFAPVITDTEIRLPILSMVKRSAGEGLKRGSCMFSLPVQASPGHKLVVKSLRVRENVNLAPGTSSRARAEIFFSGTQGHPVEILDKADLHRKRANNAIEAEVAMETTCGAGVILRGNSSITLQGGDGRSTTRLEGYDLTYSLEECQ